MRIRKVLVALGTLLGAACSSAPVEIIRNQAPGAACGLVATPTGIARSQGTFDVVLGNRASYILTPVVENNTDERLTLTRARLSVLQEDVPGVVTQVRIRCSGDDEPCAEWEVDLCEDRPCQEVSAGASASLEVPALPRDVTGYFAGVMDGAVREGRVPPEFKLTAEVVLIGEAGANTYESELFRYPITMCLGCLVQFNPAADSAALPGPDCCGARTVEPSCYPGQDEPIDCRDCIVSSPEVCNYGRLSCAG